MGQSASRRQSKYAPSIDAVYNEGIFRAPSPGAIARSTSVGSGEFYNPAKQQYRHPRSASMSATMAPKMPSLDGKAHGMYHMEPAYPPPYSYNGMPPIHEQNAPQPAPGVPGWPHPLYGQQIHTNTHPVPPCPTTQTPDPPRASAGTSENVLETLRKYDTIFIVDDSDSMNGRLWSEARDALSVLAEESAKYDTNGIDVHFLNDDRVGHGLLSGSAVKRLFDNVVPQGITPIGEKLESLLLEYLGKLEAAKGLADAGDPSVLKSIKPVNYIVITDGAPTDDPESVIVAAAKRLDARNFPMSQVGIQFVQIGNSPEATAFLEELDDGLTSQYGIRDIVDTTPYAGGVLSATLLTKILLGGINRRVDTRGATTLLRQATG